MSSPLATEKVSKLLKQFAVPSIIAMLVSAIWLSLDWLCRNQISAWAVVGLISGTAVAGIIAAIFRNYNK